MNAIAIQNSTFTIADTIISMVDGLYSLNNLHKASGNQVKHKPSNFMQNQETKDLIAEIQSENSDDGIPSSSENKAFRVVKGNFSGIKQGTYVCKELVYRYAMWISAKFSLMVIRAFDSMVSRSDSQQREVLRKACEKLATRNMLISEAYILVGKQFGYDDGIKNIPTPLLPEATAFVYEMILRLKSSQPTDTECTKKMYDMGRTKADENQEILEIISKALTDLDYSVGKLKKNNATHYSIFESLKHEVLAK